MPRAASIRNCGEHTAKPCRVARVRPNEEDQRGHLVYHPGGAWGFHYDGEASPPDDVGYHFCADERASSSAEYVSINERGKMHTYRVTSMSYL